MDKFLKRKIAIQQAQVEMLAYGLNEARYGEQLKILQEVESGEYDETNKYHRVLDKIVKSPLYEFELEAMLEDINESKMDNKQKLDYNISGTLDELLPSQKPMPITMDDFDNW